METITLRINTRSNKGKHLLGLIKEMAKDETFVEIETSVIDEIKTGLEQVKRMQAGELQKKSIKQMLHGK
jgi:hypothetical protein